MKATHKLKPLLRLVERGTAFISKPLINEVKHDIDALNKQFSILNHLQFSIDKGGFVVANINNAYAKARISTYAGQVLSYQPHSEAEDLVFLSNKAKYKSGKAIRGGVPICWPWFGNDISGLGRASHGFVRNQQWEIISTNQDSNGVIKLIFGLNATEYTRTIWPHDFELRLEISVGRDLQLKLNTKNTGHTEMAITQAIHTYFNVSDIEKTTVTGLDSVEYQDKLKGFSKGTQSGNVHISQEIDRIFQPVNDDVMIVDSGFNRTITLSATGSKTTVIWNPWTTAVSDLSSKHYHHFLCVETANAANDSVTLLAGESHSMSVAYRVC